MTERDRRAVSLGMPYRLDLPGVPALYLRGASIFDAAHNAGEVVRAMYPEIKGWALIDVRD